MNRILERLSHPVIELAWRLASENKCLRAELDQAKGDLAVAMCREKRWKKAAYIACEGNPDATRLLDWQAMSDDWADADEVAPHERNAPRSAP